MNIDELRTLKAKLVDEKKQRDDEQKFYPVFVEFDEKSEKEPVSLKTIKEQEKTEECVEKCIELIKKTMVDLVEQDIKFDQIALESSLGLFVKPELYSKIKEFRIDAKFYLSDGEVHPMYLRLLDDLKKQASMEYVPIRFFVSPANTGLEDLSVDDVTIGDKLIGDGYDIITSSVKTPKDLVEGIVNLPLFISRMKELGVDIRLLNYGELSSMDDYISSIQTNGDDELIQLYADFGRKEKKEQQGIGK